MKKKEDAPKKVVPKKQANAISMSDLPNLSVEKLKSMAFDITQDINQRQGMLQHIMSIIQNKSGQEPYEIVEDAGE